MRALKRNIIEKGDHIMNIGILLLVIIGGAAGLLSTLYLVVSMIWVLIYKIYRKIRYHASLYD